MSEVATIVVRPAVKVIIEQEGGAWSAYAPSVPGCGTAGKSCEEVERLIEEALTFHLAGLHEDGLKEMVEEMADEAAGRAAYRKS